MLVYLVASDLEVPAVNDLENMVKAPSSPDVEVIVQIGGGATPGAYPGIDMQKTQRYRLVPAQPSQAGNEVVGNGWKLERLPQAQQPAQVAMNVSSTLQDFIEWGTKSYPAEQFHLALWNHGGGPVHGFGFDKALGAGQGMTVADITLAIRNAGVHFEMVGFDACLMASLEVAAALQPYANYLVASEEVTMGWDWSAVVGHMVSQPLASGHSLGQAIVESYKPFWRTNMYGKVDFTAYAVTDLRAVPALVQALESAFSELQRQLDTRGIEAWTGIAAARHAAEDFQSGLFVFGAYDLVDVFSFMEKLAQRGWISNDAMHAIESAHMQAVLVNDGGEDEAHGLMMYFPAISVQRNDILTKYSSLEFSPAILGFVERYARWVHSSQMPQVTVDGVQLNGHNLVATVNSNQPGIPTALSGAYAVLYDGMHAVAMQPMSAQGNALELADAANWPTLGGEVVSLIPEGDQDNVFLIPVESDGDRGMLYAFKDAKGALNVRLFAGANTSAGAGMSMLEVHPGQTFFPLRMNMTSMKLEAADEAVVAPVGDWVVEMQSMQGNHYSLRAVAVDLAGRLNLSAQSTPLP